MHALLDRAHFSHMTGADTALQREIVELFRGQVRGWTDSLDPANAGWRDAAHTMKGSARGIGLMALADVCHAVETMPNAEAAAATALLRAALDEAFTALTAYDDELARAPAR
jgi:HPt (histidine-containing phosphotransfer) domain-containing protein